jgi:protocatechuate 3,4-dioxygenase beta subunit
MKIIQRISPLLVLAVALNARCQTADLVKISGSVVDKEGHPVTDASVDYYEFPTRGIAMQMPDFKSKQHTTTDSAGAFSFSVPSGAATVVASKSGLAPAWKTFQSTPDRSLDPLVLSMPTVLAGIVLDENNHPLANAEVTVSLAMDKPDVEWSGQPNFLFGKAASQLFSARTFEDGRFRIENFPPGGQADLAVNIPGRALRSPSMPWNGFQMQAQAGQRDIKLITDPAGGIEGKVVLRDTETPLAGAQFQLQHTTPGGGFLPSAQSVHSTANGSFRITDLPSGAYTVTAIFTNQPLAPWVSERVPVTVTAGETARNITIEAFKGGVIEVTVTAKSDSKALADVNVTAYAQDYQAGTTTGSNGVALLRLPPGPFTIMAMKQGRSQAQSQTTVTEGATNQVRLALNSPFKITGTVTDTSGAPVPNTSLGVFPNYNGDASDAKSDSSGHYELTWQKPAWAGAQNQRFFLVARSMDRNLAALHEVDESTKNLDVDLKPAMSISGRIQDVKGKPITNATAFLMLQTENFGFQVSRQPIRVDAQGRIEVKTLPLGEHYNLSALAKGYGSGNQQMDNPNPNADHYDFPPIILNLADRKIAGRVLGTNGQPVTGVNVWMNGEGQPNGNATTDASGRFAFDACPGAVSLSANGEGLYANADAMAGDTNVVIRFNSNNTVFSQNSLTVSGTVYDSSGRPAVGAHVAVTPAWGMANSAVTDENGEYSLQWQDQAGMRNAKYSVIARDTEQNLAGIEPLDAKTTRVSVHMVSGFSISGTILDSSSAPITHADVNLNIMVGNMGGMVDQQPVRVAADGTFIIPALPLGQQYSVWIRADGYGSGQKMISKAQSRSNSIQLAPFKLRTADHELAGQVLDADGKPLPGAWVNIYGNNQPNGNIRSDATGHFKFKVCSGPIYVNAFRPSGGGPNNYGSSQARGGDMNVVVKLGSNPGRTRNMARSHMLKPGPWTLGALIAWPTDHKKAAMILLSLQTVAVLGTAAGVFWATRKRDP